MRIEKRALAIVGSAFLAAGIAVGCGDDSDGGSGDVSTGIAPSKLLADLTPNEATQACQRFQAGFEAKLSGDGFIRMVCTLFGAAFADTPSACATQRDMCIEQASQAGSQTMMTLEMNEVEFQCGESSFLEECSAGTVGQLESCANDTLDQVDALFGQWTCDDAATITMGDLEGFGDGIQPAASCENIECGDGPFGMP